MASSLARIVASAFLSKPLRPAVAVVSRSFGSRAVPQYDNHGGDRSLEVHPGRCDDFFSDVLDPFSPTHSLSKVFNFMDQFMDNPFLSASSCGDRFSLGWDAKETDDALHLRIDMPRLDKGDVKVSVIHDTLTIKGEGGKHGNDDEHNVRRYSNRIDLPEKIYKINQIKAEMKNGVLKVVVPKLEDEERNDLYQIKIE